MNLRTFFQGAVFLGMLLLSSCSGGRKESRVFEMRWFSPDGQADGITDFHGPTEYLTTEERVAALGAYARFASRFWNDPGLDTPLFTDEWVRDRLSSIKPQPTTSVRRTLELAAWKAYGTKEGKETLRERERETWTRAGAHIEDGSLVLEGTSVTLETEALCWRWRLKGTLGEGDMDVVLSCNDSLVIPVTGLRDFEVYGDLENRTVFLSCGDRTIREFRLHEDSGPIAAICLRARSARLDAFSLYNFVRQPDSRETPYRMELLYEDDFEPVLPVEGWQYPDYDDGPWQEVSLPAVHGGLAEAGESWYLRKKIHLDGFGRAYLDMETLDPSGELWVNGQCVAVLEGRLPRHLDVTRYLVPHSENLIAVKVNPGRTVHPTLHALSDHNTGWFLGRSSLVLTDGPAMIRESLIHTAALCGEQARQHHCVSIQNVGREPFLGTLKVSYYPWFPEDGACVGSASKEIVLPPEGETEVEMDLDLTRPALWSPQDPRLYKVEIRLEDSKGVPRDDWVTTTGVRLIEQRSGVLYVNHCPEVLIGAQIFGFRRPLETCSKTIRCGTSEMVLRDLLMDKAMDANLLRLHVHTEKDLPDGINDPRYAEYADQLGLYLIWQTPAWLREGEATGVDVESYPLYMRQVYNHPSIIMWEASNHPNRFKRHGLDATVDYFNSIIPAILAVDASRLVSPTSYWPHTHYANYEGTVDYKGNPIEPNPLLMHRKMTRGSQDAYTGYGTDWSALRQYPYPWAKSCLGAKDLCYFNFEHEESAAQPNWELARKEPWYQVQSYEWPYEKGSIGRCLEANEWRESQAWQAFSAWESMKLQLLSGVSGFSWCSLESGANMFTYQKPLVDPFLVPKLAFHANKMAAQRCWAGSEDVDTVYGPGDSVCPLVFNLGEACLGRLTVELQDASGAVLDRKVFRKIRIPCGRSVTRLEPFRFRDVDPGCHFVVYRLQTR